MEKTAWISSLWDLASRIDSIEDDKKRCFTGLHWSGSVFIKGLLLFYKIYYGRSELFTHQYRILSLIFLVSC